MIGAGPTRGRRLGTGRAIAVGWLADALGSACVPLANEAGRVALAWHLPSEAATHGLTGTVRAWRRHWPALLPRPQPSPRNNRGLEANPWFAAELVPALLVRVRALPGPG